MFALTAKTTSDTRDAGAQSLLVEHLRQALKRVHSMRQHSVAFRSGRLVHCLRVPTGLVPTCPTAPAKHSAYCGKGICQSCVACSPAVRRPHVSRVSAVPQWFQKAESSSAEASKILKSYYDVLTHTPARRSSQQVRHSPGASISSTPQQHVHCRFYRRRRFFTARDGGSPMVVSAMDSLRKYMAMPPP